MPLGGGRAPVTRVAPPSGSAPRLLIPGSMLGPYELGARIGEGGMSAVYAATDRALDRPVAVKVLHPNLQGDDGIRRRFVREGRIARGWAHPNVVPVLDTVVDGEVVALVMERVDAPTLARVLEQWRDGLPLRELAEVADGLLAGLEAAHGRGIVHSTAI
jgi:serine/threonine-protein kinase